MHYLQTSTSNPLGVGTLQSQSVHEFTYLAPDLSHLREREQAAKDVCAGILGDVYILSEVADYLITQTIGELKNKKWYRFQFKHHIRTAHDNLIKVLSLSVVNSSSGSRYMREVADKMYTHIESDVVSIEKAIQTKMINLKVQFPKAAAKLLTVEIFLDFIKHEYEQRVLQMCEVYGDKDFYDSWFGSADCHTVITQWKAATNIWQHQFLKDVDVDLNKISAIIPSLERISRTLCDLKVINEVTTSAAAEQSPGSGQEMYSKAYDILFAS